jgi:PIN domain nuclease of toxin-antitoxin system
MAGQKVSDRFVLDTHVWFDLALGRTGTFTPRVLRRVDAAAQGSTLYIAAVTPWEVAMLARAGKIRSPGPVLAFVLGALRHTRTAVAPFEPATAVDAVELPWDHRDPADRWIVATARALDAVLVTRDGAMLDYATGAKAVRTLDPRS